MAYSDNTMASLQPWSSFRPTSFTDSWISDALSRETETFTKALQQSLSRDNNSETLITTANDSNNNSFNQFTQISPAISCSDPETTSKRRNNLAISNGKISKRKSRATKRSPVTFITTDPTNFREQVQQFTGIPNGNFLPTNLHAPVIKPEPKRFGAGNGTSDLLNSYSLPTLDTSTFLLNQQHHQHQPQQQQQQAFQIDDDDDLISHLVNAGSQNQSQMRMMESSVGLGFDYDFQSFPTLESFGVI
ncbi:hypothetical protein MKX01_037885 [Papaver californicum]|nr:hypothetical protein MKX01_037885 [Papaver californicum]